MRNFNRLALTLMVLIAAAARTSDAAEPAKPDFSTVRDYIRKCLVDQQIPSLAVAVARDREIIWEEAFGWADREKRRPATPHTLYSLASISKPITATGLMVLKQRGRIDLDRPINDYLSAAKLKAWIGNAKEATVRRVANHTSGLSLHYHFFYSDEVARPPSMDETIRRYGNIVFSPGERFSYSNLGYGILDYVIAQVSRKSYADFMREEVFLPLGMTRASVGIGPGLDKFAATRYGKDGLPLPSYDFDHAGASAAYCSAHDLVRFGMFHAKAHLPDQKAILSDSNIDAMQEIGPQFGPTNCSIGWFVEKSKNHHVVQHTGGMPGVTTYLVIVPADKIVVAVLCNTESVFPELVVARILEALKPGFILKTVVHEIKSQADGKSSATGVARPKGEWRGRIHTYNGKTPITLWFKESGDVHVQLADQLKTLLNEVRYENGELTGVMLGEIGTDDANRRPYHLHLDLKLRDKSLTGAVMAISRPGQRDGSGLTHWVELRSGSWFDLLERD